LPSRNGKKYKDRFYMPNRNEKIIPPEALEWDRFALLAKRARNTL
jgi:hypothetical protein